MSGYLERYRWFIAALFAVPLVLGIAFLLSERLSDPRPLQLDLADVPAEEIRVYVTGAVQRPGVYPLTDGDRWIDALEAAGGPTADANLAALDLARRARDEDTILVPSLSGAGVASSSQAPLVDINTASAAILETLPGIGEVRAGRIIDSRERDGPFASADGLLERDLISLAVFEEIADLVTVGPSSGQTGQ